MNRYKYRVFFALVMGIFSIAVLARVGDPIRTAGDPYGDSNAYESALHFSQDGFAASAFLMNRNFGPHCNNYYIHHGLAGVIPYAFAVMPDVPRSLAIMRCIAFVYFLVFIIGFFFWSSANCRSPSVPLAAVMLCLSNVLFLNAADILENTDYFTPLIFWVLLLFEDIVHKSLAKRIPLLKTALFFLLVFVDARFSRLSIFLLSIMLATDSILILYERRRDGFTWRQFRIFSTLAGVAICAMTLSTAIYFWQTAIACDLDMSAVLTEASGTMGNEQGIWIRVSLAKIIFFIFLSPPHFLLASVAAIGFLLDWRGFLGEKRFRTTCCVSAVAASGMLGFVLLVPGHFLQHVQYYGLILIMALYLPVAYVLLHWMRKLKKQRFWSRQSILPWCFTGAAACSILFGLHFFWLQNKLRVCVPFDSAAHFQQFIPSDASVLFVNSSPGPHIYVGRHFVGRGGIVSSVDGFEKVLSKRRPGVPVFVACFEGNEFSRPRVYLFGRMIDHYLAFLPKPAAIWAKERIPSLGTPLDPELTSYLQERSTTIAELPNGKATLSRWNE